MPQGSAHEPGIVPARPASSSDVGRSAVLTTGAAPESATVDNVEKRQTVGLDCEIELLEKIIKVDSQTTGLQAEDPPVVAGPSQIVEAQPPQGESVSEKTCDAGEIVAQVTSGEDQRKPAPDEDRNEESCAEMEWEKASTLKRKKARPHNNDSPTESEEDVMEKPKSKMRNRRILHEDEVNKGIRVYPSNPDVSNLGTSDQASEKEDESKREKKKVGRPKKKIVAVDPDDAERKVIARTGQAPEHFTEDVLNAMTASDLSAQALDYLEHIEVIRSKSGKLQGGLSGELRRRKQCLDDIVRALQYKAESKSDPEFLKHKISELQKEIKRNKMEEEKRKREVSELRDVIAELRKDNRVMREEMRKIKEEVARNSREKITSREEEEVNKERRGGERKETGHELKGKRNLPVKKMRPYVEEPEKRKSLISDSEYLPDEMAVVSRDVSPAIVLRPLLGGRTAPLLSPGNLKREERLDIISRQIEALTKARAKIYTQEEGINDDVRNIEGMDGIEREEGRVEDIRAEGVNVEKPLPQRKPRIIVKENIQLVPPGPKKEEEKEWIIVGKRDKRKRQRSRDKVEEKEGVEGQSNITRSHPSSQPATSGTEKKNNRGQNKIPKRRLPKTAAVSIKGKDDCFSYADALRKARTKISLDELQIGSPKIRKGVNGATIIEIAGQDNTEKADKLASKLQEIIEDAIITRPVIKGELRILGIDDSVTKEEIEWMITEEGGCSSKDILVGPLRATRSGMNTVWIRCPLQAAIAIAKKGKVRLGWTVVKVELLKARPIQCYRCWRYGHVKQSCRSNIDYRGCCFQCGREGHTIKMCKYKVRCILCSKLGLDDQHRVGSLQCEGVKSPNIGERKEIPLRRGGTEDSDGKDSAMQHEPL